MVKCKMFGFITLMSIMAVAYLNQKRDLVTLNYVEVTENVFNEYEQLEINIDTLIDVKVWVNVNILKNEDKIFKISDLFTKNTNMLDENLKSKLVLSANLIDYEKIDKTLVLTYDKKMYNKVSDLYCITNTYKKLLDIDSVNFRIINEDFITI